MTGQTPDIFLSYSRQDIGIAGKMAATLAAAGHDVWWDQALKSGEAYDKVTETALLEARVVIVLWSKASVASDWVRSEATVALQRGALLPVMIEACRRPVMFELRQSADLAGWKGNAKDPRLVAFLADLARQLATPATAMRAPLAAATPASGPNRRLLIGGAVAVVAAALAGGGWWVMGRGDQATENSIAVLPFANLSGDPAKAYFSDGIAEELRSALARIAGLKVAARTSSEKMREADAKEAAAKLGVSHVLTGSVRKGDGMLRVSAQLVDGDTGLEEWSQSYDRPEGDAIAVQSGIAESVANALSLTLGKAAAMLGGTQSPAAYDAYLRGRGIITDRPETTRAALAAFDAAIAVDPRFAAAHAERSLRLSQLIRWTNLAETAPTQRLALAAAQRAIELEPLLPRAHYAIGRARQYQLQLRPADAAFARALKLPGLSSGELAGIGLFRIEMGLGDAGLALVEQAFNLDPLNPDRDRARVEGLIILRRFADALSAIAVFDAANPGKPIDPIAKAGALLGSGDAKRALAIYQQALPNWLRYRGEALAHAKLGDRAASDRSLAAMRADVDLIAFQTAEVYAIQGERELALTQLALAVRIRDPGLMGLRSSPALDSLRAEPRFAAIEEQVGFPPM